MMSRTPGTTGSRNNPLSINLKKAFNPLTRRAESFFCAILSAVRGYLSAFGGPLHIFMVCIY